MSHVLITFLGRGEKDTNDLYRQEEYQFVDDNNKYRTSFFGLAVLEHLKNKGSLLNKIVILGTPSSTWNALYELKGEVEEKYEDDWIALGDAITENFESPEEEEIEEERIIEYFPTLQKYLTKYLNSIVKGIQCELRIIPYGDSQEKQIAILEKMAECVKELKEKDSVSLDITHGLRHLPMLTVLSAMYLEVVQKVEIAGIYYGAMEMKNRHDGIAHALNLNGILQITKWVKALSIFDNNGNYSVFANLLEEDGLNTKQTKHLEKAAFFERIFNTTQAAHELKAFHSKAFHSTAPNLPGMSHFFNAQLLERTNWHQKGSLYESQRNLAYLYLDKQDYPRATILAVEAFITKLMSETNSKDIYNYHQRLRVVYDFLDGELGNKNHMYDFKLLRKLRNGLVHNDMPQGEIKHIIESEQSLESTLRKLLNSLLD